jgi:thioredoxin-like negative regulator of GroEL
MKTFAAIPLAAGDLRRALAAALLTAAGLAAAAPAAAQAPADPPPPRWHRQVAPALAAAEAADKLVLVDLYADWCSWCKVLDAEFRTAHFARWAEDYVLLRVDVEDRGEGTALKEHLGVRGLPTTAIIDHAKVRVGLLTGFQPAPQLTRSLDRVVETYREKRRRLAEQAAGDDRDDRLAAADELRAMYAGGAAAPVYRGVLAGDELDAAERARIGAALGDALIIAGELAAAERSLADARRALAGVDGSERTLIERLLDGLTLQLTRDLGECDQVAELQTFLEQHPASSFAGQVRSRLDHLKTGPAAGCV